MSYDDTIEKLNREIAQLLDKEAEVDRQLRAAKDRAKEGHYENQSWFRSANLALKKTRKDLEVKRRAVKLIERRQDRELKSSVEHCFMEMAEKRLCQEVYDSLLYSALKEAENRNGDNTVL